jgi:death on curing protein
VLDRHNSVSRLPELRYLDPEDVIAINQLVLRQIKIRRADSPRVLSKKKLGEITQAVHETEGDAYDKAVTLIMGLVRGHPFASGNRRTAFVATKLFLEMNSRAMEVDHNPDILLGIREGFYTANEIKSWLKGNAIKKFARGSI